MNIKAAIFAVTIAAAGAVCAASSDKSELRAAYDASAVVLKDDSFYRSWEASPEISSVDQAEKLIARAEELNRRLDKALEAQKAYCRTKFLENACTEKAVSLVNERRRELRKVEVAARDAVRRANTEQLKKKRAEEASKPRKKPIEYSPKLKAPAEPIDYVPKTRRGESVPMDLAPKSAENPSSPRALNSEQAGGASREELEKKNLEYYEAKQREAAERKAQADERAAKRREERLKQKERFAETLKEREEAQKRYEEKMKNKDSGISRFMPGFE